MGTILGAFVSGLATRKTSEEKEARAGQTLTEAVPLCANELELTPAQRVALDRFLVLLAVKLGTASETAPDSKAAQLSLDELQRLAAITGLQPLVKQDLTLEEARQMLLKLGLCNQK